MPYGDCDAPDEWEDERDMERWGIYQRDNYTEAATRASNAESALKVATKELKLLSDKLEAVNIIRVRLTKMWQKHCFDIPDNIEEILKHNLIDMKKVIRQP